LNLIQRTFLRAKHWEIFLLGIAVRLFFRVATNTFLGNAALASTAHLPDTFLVRLLQEGNDIALYAWAYFTGSFFNAVSPARLRIRPAGFFLAMVGLVALELMPRSWGISLPADFATLVLFLICYASVVRFPSKTLVLAEEQELASNSDYKNEFILAFFYPIGIWWLQPRINEVYAAHQNLSAPTDPVLPAAQAST